MERTSNGVTPSEFEEIRALRRWSLRYVQSRALPVLIGIGIFGALMAALLALWTVAGDAYRAGDWLRLGACAIGLVAAHAALVWLSVPRWGGKHLERWAWRYYRDEGQATQRLPWQEGRSKRVGAFVACVFGACILLHVGLGLAGVVSDESVLPISALYVVPFLIFIFSVTRTYVMLLMPALYAAHALIVAAGFRDPFDGFVPLELRSFAAILVYCVLAVFVSHVYNRIALSRMARHGREDS